MCGSLIDLLTIVDASHRNNFESHVDRRWQKLTLVRGE